MNDKEIYEQLWEEYHNRDAIDYLRKHIQEALDCMNPAFNYSDRVILSRDHMKMILKGLDKL